MWLENSLNHEKWRTIEGRPRCLQRTFIKRVWPTQVIFRASLRCKLVPKHHRSSVRTDRSSFSRRKILLEKYAARSSRVKYPLMRTKRLCTKCSLRFGVVCEFVVVYCSSWACVLRTLVSCSVVKSWWIFPGQFELFQWRVPVKFYFLVLRICAFVFVSYIP